MIIIYSLSSILKHRWLKQTLASLKREKINDDIKFQILIFHLTEILSLSLLMLLLIYGKLTGIENPENRSSLVSSLLLYLMVIILLANSVLQAKKILKEKESEENNNE